MINARAAQRPRVSGVERWARELTRGLPALRPERYVSAVPPRPLAQRAGHVWEQALLPGYAARLRAELILSPANLAPLAWPRNVVVLHDAVAFAHPEWYSRTFVASQRTLVARAARRARRVIAPSAFARAEIVDLLRVRPERVEVVPPGVGERFRPDADAEGARRAHGLSRPYALTVSGLHTRKNLPALEASAAALAERGLELVVAGASRAHQATAPEVTGLRLIGYVDEASLPGLYAGAEAFVLPSRHEGFGLPCLEAMASGTPVVAADRGALPETCGDAALLVDAEDSGAVSEALLSALDEPVRDQLRSAGLRRARKRTWERTVGAVDAVVAAALAE